MSLLWIRTAVDPAAFSDFLFVLPFYALFVGLILVLLALAFIPARAAYFRWGRSLDIAHKMIFWTGVLVATIVYVGAGIGLSLLATKAFMDLMVK